MHNTENPMTVGEVRLSYTPAAERITIDGSKSACKVLRSVWDQELLTIQEQFYALFLNNAHEVICWRLICTGTGNQCLVDQKLLAAIACKTLAAAVIIAHNHPSGKVAPSGSDKRITMQLRKALAYFDIRLLDHLIITNKSYYSFGDKSALKL